MRMTIAVLSLLLAVEVSALNVAIPAQRTLNPVVSPRKAKVLRDARAAFTLPDGSQWIVHTVPAKREPSALGVTRFGADGAARVFLVSDWLPEGTIPGGSAGQVYGVGMLNDGRVLVSAGWQNHGGSHNAIFVLSAEAGGTYHTDKVFEVPGAAEIVGGPVNTILAVTNYPAMRGGGPLLTHFNTEGLRLGAFGSGDVSPAAAAKSAMAARLHRINENLYALYIPSREEVAVFHLSPGDREFIWSPRRHVFLGEDAAAAGMRVLGLESAGMADDLLVVRSGLYRGRPGTLLTVFGKYHKEKQSEFLDVPWNLMLREFGVIHGVVHRGDVHLDTVALKND